MRCFGLRCMWLSARMHAIQNQAFLSSCTFFGVEKPSGNEGGLVDNLLALSSHRPPPRSQSLRCVQGKPTLHSGPANLGTQRTRRLFTETISFRRNVRDILEQTSTRPTYIPSYQMHMYIHTSVHPLCRCHLGLFQPTRVMCDDVSRASLLFHRSSYARLSTCVIISFASENQRFHFFKRDCAPRACQDPIMWTRKTDIDILLCSKVASG